MPTSCTCCLVNTFRQVLDLVRIGCGMPSAFAPCSPGHRIQGGILLGRHACQPIWMDQ